jgi:hypothetical protein
MKRIFSVIFILLFTASFFVIAEENVQAIQVEIPTQNISSINELLKATIAKLGNSRSSVVAQLGVPLSISIGFMGNPDKPLQDDKIYALDYDGIIIWIYQDGANKKEKLVSVRITKNSKELPLELIGKSEKDIISIFGQPASYIEGKMQYDSLDNDESGLGILELEFKHSSVDAVELTYYVD